MTPPKDEPARRKRTSEPRPLRADAERNRRRLLAAAARAFATYGPDASGVQIAREAGVGQGTLYRRFPTREHLLTAIVTDLFDQLAAQVAEVTARHEPGAAVHGVLAVGAQMGVQNRMFVEAMATNIEFDGPAGEAYDRLVAAIDDVLTRAQRAGEVRADVTAEDLIALIGAISNSGMALYSQDASLWRRYLDLIFDGLRPAAANPLSHPAPTGKILRRRRSAAEAELGPNSGGTERRR